LSRLLIHSKGEAVDPRVEVIAENGGGAGVRLRNGKSG
jgi:hypothetical protein